MVCLYLSIIIVNCRRGSYSLHWRVAFIIGSKNVRRNRPVRSNNRLVGDWYSTRLTIVWDVMSFIMNADSSSVQCGVANIAYWTSTYSLLWTPVYVRSSAIAAECRCSCNWQDYSIINLNGCSFLLYARLNRINNRTIMWMYTTTVVHEHANRTDSCRLGSVCMCSLAMSRPYMPFYGMPQLNVYLAHINSWTL
jgi:hypothetical protein